MARIRRLELVVAVEQLVARQPTASARADPSPRRGTDGARRRRPSLALVAVVVVGGAFLLANRAVIGGPYGFSFDGQNAGQFGLQIRAMEEHGLLASRLGGKYAAAGQGRLDVTYADHPPLIYVEGYLTRAVAGTGPAATRAAAWIGSLAALALLAWLLLDAGLSPPAVAAGLALGFGSRMFFVYGTMLDTFITSVPFGLAALLAAQRTVRRRPFPTAVTVLLGALAALAGWQAFLVACCGVLWVLVRRRRDPAGWRQAAPLGAGVLAGFVAVVAWVVWVDGSLGQVLSQGAYRADGVTVGSWASFQLAALDSLFNPLVLILSPLFFAAAWRDARTRGPAMALLGTVVIYTAAFRQGANRHEYWNYWLILALAVAGAAAVELVRNRLRGRQRSLAMAGFAVLTAFCVVLPAFFDHTFNRRDLTTGMSAPALLRQAQRTRGGPITVAVHAPPDDRESWIPYLVGTATVTYQTAPQLAAAAATHPGLLVFTPLGSPGARRSSLLEQAVVANDHFALVPASAFDAPRNGAITAP